MPWFRGKEEDGYKEEHRAASEDFKIMSYIPHTNKSTSPKSTILSSSAEKENALPIFFLWACK